MIYSTPYIVNDIYLKKYATTSIKHFTILKYQGKIKNRYTEIRISRMEVIILEKAKILKEKIEATGMSVRKFSESIGMPYTTLRSILERGAGKSSIDNVIKICRALDISVEQLDDMSKGLYKDELFTVAAHHDSEEWTDEELEELENFKQYVLSKRKR